MTDEFEFVAQLSEPLINEDYDDEKEFEKRRLDIMRRRDQKKRDLIQGKTQNDEDANMQHRSARIHSSNTSGRLLNDNNAVAQQRMRTDIMPYLTSPHSPVAKVYNAILSPAQYVVK